MTSRFLFVAVMATAALTVSAQFDMSNINNMVRHRKTQAGLLLARDIPGTPSPRQR